MTDTPVESRAEGARIPTQPLGEAPPLDEVLGWIGRVVDGRYRVLEPLGEGGMALVYLAEHVGLRKRVALKMLAPGPDASAELLRRFAIEAEALARIDHPHVAAAIDWGMAGDGRPYLVTQLVEGRTLCDVRDQEGPLAWPVAAEIVAQIADGLDAVHAAGLVHRDLKPENVLVETTRTGTPRARLIDFGIARFVEAPRDGQLTKIGTTLGTPGYMAPEQLAGGALDGRADLYGAGILLWELIAGEPLFAGAEVDEVLRRQLRGVVPALRSRARAVPDELDALVARMLARDPARRVQDAAEARDALRSLVRPPATPARPVSGGHVPRPVQRLRAPGIAWAIAFTAAVMFAVAAGAAALVAATSAETADARPKLVPKVVRRPRAVPTRPPDRAGPEDTEMAERIATIGTSRRRSERLAAARWILDPIRRAQMPPVAIVLANLERAPSCTAKRAQIRRAREIDDPRALSAIERLARRPREGCGFLERSDCLACARADIAATRRALTRTVVDTGDR